MGMAASQARYLGLTARKINVEYEGQQVNQQRTALANQSADLFRKLVTLNVPTPPEQTSYYTEQYAFNNVSSADGKSRIQSITQNPDGKTYTVVYTDKESVPNYGGVTNQKVSVTGKTGEKKIQLASSGRSYDLSEKTTMTKEQAEEFNKLGLTPPDKQNEEGDEYYCFTDSTTKTKYYINASKTGFDPTKEDMQNVNLFTLSSTLVDKTHTINNATVGTSAGGLYNKISWTDEESGASQSYSLSKDSVYDDQAYNDAMQQYTVNNIRYQKEMADINAKTEQLQQSDRTLELRLKQLDTEQEALQTEMDSVKKVIDKSVDNVFKTFQ